MRKLMLFTLFLCLLSGLSYSQNHAAFVNGDHQNETPGDNNYSENNNWAVGLESKTAFNRSQNLVLEFDAWWFADPVVNPATAGMDVIGGFFYKPTTAAVGGQPWASWLCCYANPQWPYPFGRWWASTSITHTEFAILGGVNWDSRWGASEGPIAHSSGHDNPMGSCKVEGEDAIIGDASPAIFDAGPESKVSIRLILGATTAGDLYWSTDGGANWVTKDEVLQDGCGSAAPSLTRDLHVGFLPFSGCWNGFFIDNVKLYTGGTPELGGTLAFSDDFEDAGVSATKWFFHTRATEPGADGIVAIQETGGGSNVDAWELY